MFVPHEVSRVTASGIRRLVVAGIIAGACFALSAVAVRTVEIIPGDGSRPDPPRERLDLNLAGPKELERLPGFTEALSRRIIAHRPYRKIDDLVRMKVLGRKELAAIKEFVTIRLGEPDGGVMSNAGSSPQRSSSGL